MKKIFIIKFLIDGSYVGLDLKKQIIYVEEAFQAEEFLSEEEAEAFLELYKEKIFPEYVQILKVYKGE